MTPDRERVDKLKEADEGNLPVFTRHLCEEVLEKWPDHGPTLIRYAGALTDLALYDAAASALDHAESALPKNWKHLVFAQRGHRLANMGDFLAAEQQYLEAHRLDPDDATYLIYAGVVALRGGDVHRSEQLLRQASECSEGALDEAYFNLGGCLVVQRKYIEARDCYRKALEMDPDYILAQKALTDVEAAIKHSGDKLGGL